MSRARLGAGGFTIVELVITILVMGTLIGSVSIIVSAQSRISQHGRDLTLANAYVEHKIESLRSIGFLGLDDGTTNITSELPSELKAASGTLVIDSYSPAVKRAVITVSYSDQSIPRTYSYTTYIGELGVGQY